MLEWASSTYLHVDGAKVAASNLLAEPRSAGNEGTWNTPVANSPPHRVRGGAAAVLASATENCPPLAL